MIIEPTSGYLHRGRFYATKSEAVRAAIADIAKSPMRDYSDDLAAGLMTAASDLGPLLTSLVEESIPNDAAVSSEPEGTYPTTRQFPAKTNPVGGLASAIEHLEKRAGYTITPCLQMDGYLVYRDTKHHPVFAKHMDEEQIICLAQVHNWGCE